MAPWSKPTDIERGSILRMRSGQKSHRVVFCKTAMHKVIVRDLQKRYDDVLAAQGVSFEVEDGEIFGLLGPNGSGKTTTLECVIGLRQPESGRIEVYGIDARQHPKVVKEKIGA